MWKMEEKPRIVTGNHKSLWIVCQMRFASKAQPHSTEENQYELKSEVKLQLHKNETPQVEG